MFDRIMDLQERQLELQNRELENNRDASNQAFDVAMEHARNIPILADKEHAFTLKREARWMFALGFLVVVLAVFVFTGHEYVAGLVFTAIVSWIAGRGLPVKSSKKPET